MDYVQEDHQPRDCRKEHRYLKDCFQVDGYSKLHKYEDYNFHDTGLLHIRKRGGRHHSRIIKSKVRQEWEWENTCSLDSQGLDFQEEQEEQLNMEHVYETEFCEFSEYKGESEVCDYVSEPEVCKFSKYVYEPEPELAVTELIIQKAMENHGIFRNDILEEEVSFIEDIPKSSIRYFNVCSYGWLSCSDSQKSLTDNVLCYIDLKLAKIVYRSKPDGVNVLKTEFPPNSVELMAEQAAKKFVNKTRSFSEAKPATVEKMILKAMLDKSVLPSEIPEEPDFDLSTVKRYSKRYFYTMGFGLFICPANHCWHCNHSPCYLDLRTCVICYRFEMKCKECGAAVEPLYPFEDMKKMASFVVDLCLVCSTGWTSRSKRRSEPSKAKIEAIILGAMVEQGVLPSQIPSEQVFNLSSVTRNVSKRYFFSKSFAQILCPQEHWQSSHSHLYLDLKTRQICHRHEVICRICRTPAKPQFSCEAIQKIARYSVNQYLILTRREGGSDISDIGMVEKWMKSNTPASSSTTHWGEREGDIMSVNEMVDGFHTVKGATTSGSSNIQGQPQSCTSEIIEAIILRAMIDNYISPDNIPAERKFDIPANVKPRSVRYFKAKGFARLSCHHCRSYDPSSAYCYVDLKTQTIYCFNQKCKTCGSLMDPQFSLEAVKEMALYSVDQFLKLYRTKNYY